MVFPDKVALSFQSVPTGLGIDVDGIRKTTPFTLDDLIGFHHVISAPSQVVNGTSYGFSSWSDGGAASHSIVVPAGGGSLLATFGSGPSAHLVAAYAFDEGSGGSVGDVSGWGNDGSVVGATWTADGKFDGALDFSGSNARVHVPDSPSLDLSSQMTLEAWVRPTQGGAVWRDVIYKENDVYYLEGASPQRGKARDRGHLRHRSARRTGGPPAEHRGRTSPRPTTARPCACSSTARR